MLPERALLNVSWYGSMQHQTTAPKIRFCNANNCTSYNLTLAFLIPNNLAFVKILWKANLDLDSLSANVAEEFLADAAN